MGVRTNIYFTILILLVSLPGQAAERMTLEAFLRLVEAKNLDLKIETEKTNSADARARSLGVPPPMAGLMQMREQNGDTAQGYEINQMVPFPTKLMSNKSARNEEADAQEEMRKGLKVETLVFAKAMYVSLWASREQLSLYKEKKTIITSHLKLARASARSDSFLRIHSLKAESDIDLLENEILSAEQNLKEKTAEAARFLNVEQKLLDSEFEAPAISQIPNLEKVKLSHQLSAAQFTLESLKSKENEGRSAWLPDFYLRYRELGETRMNPKSSEVMLGISVPFVFFWEPSAVNSQVSADRMRGEYEFEKQKRQIQTEQEIMFSRAQSLKQQLDNINLRLIPRAEKRMKLAQNIAPRDVEALQDHRETMEAFPDLKIKSLDLRVQFEEAIAALGKYERTNE